MFTGQHTKQLLEQVEAEQQSQNGINLKLAIEVIPILHRYRRRNAPCDGAPARLENLSATATRLVLAADEMLVDMGKGQIERDRSGTHLGTEAQGVLGGKHSAAPTSRSGEI